MSGKPGNDTPYGAATAAHAQPLYDGAMLWYDTDGTGAAADETIVRLVGAPALGAAGFCLFGRPC
ncbi:hypothetical protein [Mesobacterium pallidum]|uniref:hypothetical protein n=1 Tax=Mesobacterium pallidum TaxID=2872037 RepID=UPI001EE1F312|nr:hypothetical protein [Mesobacterium pallidum]